MRNNLLVILSAVYLMTYSGVSAQEHGSKVIFDNDYPKNFHPYSPEVEPILFSEIPDYRNWERFYFADLEEQPDYYGKYNYLDDGTKEAVAAVIVDEYSIRIWTYEDKRDLNQLTNMYSYDNNEKFIEKRYFRFDEKLTTRNYFCNLTKVIHFFFHEGFDHTQRTTFEYDDNCNIFRKTDEFVNGSGSSQRKVVYSRSFNAIKEYNVISYSNRIPYGSGNLTYTRKLNANDFSDGFLDKIVSTSITDYVNKNFRDISYGRSFYVSGYLVDQEWDTEEDILQLYYSGSPGYKDITRSTKFDYYTIESCVNVFLDDLMSHQHDFLRNNELGSNPYFNKDQKIIATFEKLNEGVIAVSSGRENDELIKISIDPFQWEKSSKAMRFYVLYHELGHDVLNLNHGEGGRMMFNFPVGDYTWDDFFKDRDYMFKYVFDKHYSN